MRLLVAIAILAGCGRFGFSERVEIDAMTLNDTSTDDANPLDALCGDGDGDGDGIGDVCDPSNERPHRVVLYETFAVMPAGWATTGAGNWTFPGNGAHVMYTDSAASSFIAPIMVDPPLRMIVRYTIEALDPDATNFTISAVDAFDLQSEDSQKCGQASPSRKAIGYEQGGTTVDASSVAFPDSFLAGMTYVTTFDNDIAAMRCMTDVPALGPTATVSVQHAPWRSGGNVGVRIRSVAATFHSLLVIAPE